MKSVPDEFSSADLLSEIYDTFHVKTKSSSALAEYHKILQSQSNKKAVLVGAFDARKKVN